MNWWQKNKNWLVIGLLFFLNCLILRQVLWPDTFFSAHDSTWLIRLEQFDKAVSLGQFPPRLAPDMAYGYGYPIFKYYAPLFAFISWLIFKLIGDYALAITLTVFLANCLGSWGMFCLGKKLWGFWGGLIASIAFVFLPFHALDIYVRAALAELLAINIFPFFAYFLISLIEDKTNKKTLVGFILTGVALALSHNLFLLILASTLPILLIYFFWAARPRKRKFLTILGLLALILLLSAWYWLPVVTGLGDINLFGQANKTDFADHFVYLKQLWDWTWGFGGSAAGLADGLSFKIGKLQLILAILGLIAGLKSGRHRKTIAMFALLALWSLFLLLPQSYLLWEKLPFLSVIQFPWRFLGLLTTIVALLTGGIMAIFREAPLAAKAKPFLALGIAFLLGYFNLKYFSAQTVINQAREYYLDKEVIYQSAEWAAEYYPQAVVVRPEEKPASLLADSVSDGTQVVADTPFEITLRVAESEEVVVNRFYFPGWQVSLNGKNLAIEAQEDTGRIQFTAPEEGEYHLTFKTTNWERAAYLITALGLVIFWVIIFF